MATFIIILVVVSVILSASSPKRRKKSGCFILLLPFTIVWGLISGFCKAVMRNENSRYHRRR